MSGKTQANLFPELAVGAYGRISIRVVVLPKKEKGGKTYTDGRAPLDLEEGEYLPDSSGTTPLGSYMESSKGGRQCVVFLVNGQRQDALDNAFIIQQLGFKYLRNRMMIVVEVDGLGQEAIGRLMQGSRQGFFKGEVWDAIIARILATLRDDPDLVRLEEEAEEAVSELEAGDEKVKQTLDQLIDAHHEHGGQFSDGTGIPSTDQGGENLGIKTVVKDGVVSLLPPDHGAPADYPVLISQPANTTVRLRPDQPREISLRAMPSNAWAALADLMVEPDASVPELRVSQERMPDHAQLSLHFRQPDEFDTDQYPVRANLRATATFNGIKEPRRLELRVIVKPDVPPSEPVLNDQPTWIKVSSRKPVRIKRADNDAHVKLRWNGKDSLAATWKFGATLLNRPEQQPILNFSKPSRGRFSVLISPRPEWMVGDKLCFEVIAIGPQGERLSTEFDAEVVDLPEWEDAEQNKEEPSPRKVEGDIQTGATRRPPYVLKYINRDDYESVECWNGANWTDDDPGCFKEPTKTAPLTLIINKDMGLLRDYRKYLTKNYTETEVERRINKYTSHIAFHLYQMYQAAGKAVADANRDGIDQRQRPEIQRVSATLIKLMEVSR